MAEARKSEQLSLRAVTSAPADDLGARRTDELVIALVGPIGSGCTKTGAEIKRLLEATFKYDKVFYFKVSDIIIEASKQIRKSVDIPAAGAERALALQELGNELRQRFTNNYLAAKVIERIAAERVSNDGFDKAEDESLIPKPKRWCHIVDSIKNPAELSLLREVYGDMLWVIGVTAPEEVRRARLRDILRWEDAALSKAIHRDMTENFGHGQSVRDTFFQSDCFIRNDGDNDERLKLAVLRHFEVVFGTPVRTPSTDESSMYAAHAAASRSACMSRQVGAALVGINGEILAVGWNDVPKFGGGLYSASDEAEDHRCYKWANKVCHNDAHKSALYQEIFNALKAANLLTDSANLNEAIVALKETDISQLIEYSRAVHAEMSALISVARSNKPGIEGSTLYCTTFPCHSCARHMVAAGVKKLVYIEPYPKSLALELHRDAISTGENNISNRLVLEQYEGIAPRNLLRLFKPADLIRKKDGAIINFKPEIGRAHV